MNIINFLRVMDQQDGAVIVKTVSDIFKLFFSVVFQIFASKQNQDMFLRTLFSCVYVLYYLLMHLINRILILNSVKLTKKMQNNEISSQKFTSYSGVKQKSAHIQLLK
ncbi:Hypothetical_protein [Hexamita inflata]|uniref:Hypothetical_protein n=1 Tax=Hexamita inflata TaxID=28002 RepID=A0AA86P8W2_9EUKA|nr:Hypothetical protein HINF_LOCUS21927 [Hexamita inflata]